jgi:DNA-binding CsgD family transcriptional regulator
MYIHQRASSENDLWRKPRRRDEAMSEPGCAEVLDAIYSAAAEPSLWSRALSVLADHVGALAANLVYQAPPGERSFLVPGRMREDLNSLYLQHYANNPYSRAYAKLPPNRVVIGNRLVDVEAVTHSAFYADICLPQRIYNQIFVAHTTLQQPGGIGGVALFLSPDQDEHQKAAAARLARLTGNIARAIDFTLLSREQASSAKLLERLIASMSSAALLLDGQGGIVLTNAPADALLRKGDGIRIRRAERLSLVAEDAAESLRLSRNIKRSMAVAAGEKHELDGALLISRPSGLPPLQLLMMPLPPTSFSLWDTLSSRARVMVQIVDLQASPDAQADRLRMLVGLTAAEARVAALIGGGLTIPNVARLLGVSPNTVKTHLLRCYDKAGVHSRAALAQRMAAVKIEPPGN